MLRMKFQLLITSLLFCMITFGQKGIVSGTISDKDMKNEPLAFANVMIKGTTVGTTTDAQGKYSLNVEAGNSVVIVSFLGYDTVEVPVVVVANQTIDVSKSIGSGNVKLEDVKIKVTASREKETALLLDQKQAVVIKQSIGAQEMARKGISDVEEGLTKITGISKVDGRGLFVRGLEDRYNNLLINGLPVPSNNPFKKIIPLDIFPTDVVSVLETYKTFNTNIYGDFAGGTFDIITMRGGKSQTKVNFGAGFTTNNNLEKFLLSADANSAADFFGFSGTERSLPNVLGNVPSNRTLSATESNNQFGSGYDVVDTKSPLNTSFGMLHTEKFKIGNNNSNIQYFLSLNYDNKFQVREGVDRFFNVAQGNYDNDLFSKQYKFITNTSALGAITFKSNRVALTTSTFYLKTTENMIQDQLGYTNSATVNRNAFIRLNQLLETTFLNTQLLFNYKITSDERHNFKAGASYTNTSFQLPDRKTYKGVKIDETNISATYSGNSLFRQYFDFDGRFNGSAMGEYTWKFGNADLDKSHKLTVGYNGSINNVESTFRFLISQRLASNSATFNANSPDGFFRNEIANGNFTYNEGTNAIYRVKLLEFLNAGYVDLNYKFSEKFELNAGVRLEQTNRETKFREPGSFDDPYKKLKVAKADILPSLNMKYGIGETSNIRFAASKTITRPVLMEAYPLEFVNLDGTVENGNPRVVNSSNYNFDLKYELFPTAKEMFAVSAFSKLIQKPIERVFFQSAGSGGQVISYDNSNKAVLFGAEIEFLYQLKRLSELLDDFSLGFNTSLMYTKVTISNTIETNPNRQLQGASPWLVNADLKYDFDLAKNIKSSATVVYNVYGKRIFAVGTNGLDHYFEQSFNKLDFVWGNKIGNKWEAKFAVDNILNPVYKIKLGEDNKVNIVENDLTIRSFKRGVGFSMNLAYTF